MSVTNGHRKYLSNTAWLVVGKCIKMLLSLVIGIFVARHLGPSEYGLMSYVISFVTLFTFFATLGMDNILRPELIRHPDARDRYLGSALVIKLCGAVVALLLVVLTTLLAGIDSRTRTLIIVYACSAIFQSFNAIQLFFESQVQGRYGVQAELFQTVAGGLLKFYLIAVSASLELFVLVALLEWALLAGGLVFLYRKEGHQLSVWQAEWATCASLLKKSYPLILSGMTIVIYQRIDQIMLKHMCGTSVVGYYAVALRFCALVAFIPIQAGRALMPALVNARKHDRAEYQRRTQLFFDLLVWTSIVTASGLSISAPILIRLLYGQEYAASIPLLQVVAWKEVFAAMAVCSGQWIVIEGLQRYAPIRNLAGCSLNVILNLILIPRWGALGSAWATIFSIAMAGFITHLFIKPLRPAFHMQVRTLVSGPLRLLASARCAGGRKT